MFNYNLSSFIFFLIEKFKMKSSIFVKFLFVLFTTLSFCNAGYISNQLEELKDFKNDIENYLKVTKIE